MLPSPPQVLRNWRTTFLCLGITPREHPSRLVVGECVYERSGQLGSGDKAGRDDCRPKIRLVDPEPLARLLGEAKKAVAASGEATADSRNVPEPGSLTSLSMEPAPPPLSYKLDLLRT